MKKDVIFKTIVHVEVDETKFTPEFMEEYRDHYRPFETIDEHITHIAKLTANRLIDDGYAAGYGYLKDMGISVKVIILD